VIRLRKHPEEIGCIREDELLAGDLDYQDFKRLPREDGAEMLRPLRETTKYTKNTKGAGCLHPDGIKGFVQADKPGNSIPFRLFRVFRGSQSSGQRRGAEIEAPVVTWLA
jgi:hypothetical protein